ncbi:MAG: ABC transporter permease [Saprospiraceae bacterium]
MGERQKRLSIPKILLVSLVFITIFLTKFIAGNQPIVCISEGHWSFSVFEKNSPFLQHKKECSFSWNPIIPYSPYEIDTKNSHKSPFDTQDVSSLKYRHWLGTDKIGRDVASGIIHGARISLGIGLLATILGLLFGVPTGMVMGYYQDNGIQWNRIQLFLLFLLIILFGFYFFFLFEKIRLILWIPILISCFFVIKCTMDLTGKLPYKKYNFPIDLLGFRVLEWRKSIPALFLLLALLSLFSKPSLWHIIGIIALLSWADIARLIRAETLTLKNQLYVQSAVVMGFSHGYIMYKYILPGLKGTIVVIAVYIMAGTILMEATLSFLGIGLPVEEVTWGKMLSESRNAKSWWMAVFPGFCLISLLFYLHKFTHYKNFE